MRTPRLALLRSAARCAAAWWLLAYVGNSQAAGWYFEGTSTLASKRLAEPIVREHKMWLTEQRLRFDDGNVLTTVVQVDTNQVLFANRAKKLYLPYAAKDLLPVLADMGDTMARTVARRVTRLKTTKTIGGRPCTLCRFYVSDMACPAWVEDGSAEAFQAVRALARGVERAVPGRDDAVGIEAAVSTAVGGLGGIPREITVGDPERVQLTWTIGKYERREIPPTAFELPVDYRLAELGVNHELFTLPEHIYFLAEIAAAQFAPPGERNSLLPLRFAVTDSEMLRTFYEGRPDADRFQILRWAEPVSFYLAPDLWRFPLSGRGLNLVYMLLAANARGALRFYPSLPDYLRTRGK